MYKILYKKSHSVGLTHACPNYLIIIFMWIFLHLAVQKTMKFQGTQMYSDSQTYMYFESICVVKIMQVCNTVICFYLWHAECTVTDLRDSEITVRGETVDQRCIDRGFTSNTSISGGVVCYSGTMNGSRAVYICDNNTQSNEVTRVCQNDGTWNGTIPSCPGIIVYSTHN